MVSADLADVVEVILSHPASSCVFLLSILWFIRDSLKVSNFSQRNVLITGCDSGFGNLLARQLDGRGFRVIAACLTEEGASDLSASASPRLKTLRLDVTDSASIRRAVEAVRAEVGERGEDGEGGGDGEGATDKGASPSEALEEIKTTWTTPHQPIILLLTDSDLTGGETLTKRTTV